MNIFAKERKLMLMLTLFSILLFVPVTTHSAVPLQIGYQGYLTDSSETPLTGSHLVKFYLYNAPSGGTQLWNEQQTVSLHDGVFNVQLGSETSLELDDFEASDLYLEIEVFYSGSGWEILTPRQKVTSTAFALKSGNADRVGGQTMTDLNTAFVNAGESGSITSAMIADSSIGAADLANNSVGSGEIINGSVTAADLSDDYVNTTGDTMTGDLTLNSNLNVSTSSTSSTDFAASFTSSSGIYASAIKGVAASTEGEARGLYLDVDSSNDMAYGAVFDVSAPNFEARGIDLNVDGNGSNIIGLDAAATSTSPTGYGQGIRLTTTSYGDGGYGTLGINNNIYQYGTGHLTGMDIDGAHSGSAGNTFGLDIDLSGSDAGDVTGVLADVQKNSSDTAGTAYGGRFIADNDRTGGISYGLYTEATGLAGPRYGLYSIVNTSGGSSNGNYGVYSKVSNADYMAYGYYADVDSDSSSAAYGAVIDLDKSSSSTSNLFGLHLTATHAGASGYVYGISSSAYAADSGDCYGGYFSAYSNSGDTGSIYGVRSYCDNDTSGDKYAGYFYKLYGGDYAGYFYGNVHIAGSLTATSKSFIQPHKTDPSKEIVYVSIESREHAVVIRGNARLEDGEAVIEMPEDWEQVVADDGITVNLTPEGAWAPLYVASKSKKEVIVQVGPDGPDDVDFSYCIMAQRDGFQDHQPIRENKHFTADNTSAWEFENRITEDTLDNIAIRKMLKSNGIMKQDGTLNTDVADSLGWKTIPNEKDPHFRQAHKMPPLDDLQNGQ